MPGHPRNFYEIGEKYPYLCLSCIFCLLFDSGEDFQDLIWIHPNIVPEPEQGDGSLALTITHSLLIDPIFR